MNKIFLAVITAILLAACDKKSDELVIENTQQSQVSPQSNTARNFTPISEEMSNSVLMAITAINMLYGVSVDKNQIQADYKRFAQEYNQHGTVLRKIPQSIDEFREFEKTNYFLTQVVTPIIKNNMLIYSVGDEIIQISKNINNDAAITYYLINHQPVLANITQVQKGQQANEIYHIANHVSMATSKGNIDWTNANRAYQNCAVCYKEITDFLPIAQQEIAILT